MSMYGEMHPAGCHDPDARAHTSTSDVETPDVELVNLTPHDVVIIGDGCRLVLTPEASPARCVIERTQVDQVMIGEQSISVYQSTVTDPPVLPGRRAGVLLVVSRMVAEAVPEREDLVFPDGLVRADDGSVIGCTALARIR